MDRLIPFTPDVYIDMIARYNEGMWPGHLAGLALMWGIIACARRSGRVNAGIVLMIIAGFWVWVGYGFHIERYAQLNWAAVAFGWIFIAQGGVILLWAVLTKTAEVSFGLDRFSMLGGTLLLAAVALHPIFASAAGWPLATMQTAGTTPLTMLLVTFAGFAFLRRRPPLWAVTLPLLWSIWDGLWAWTLGLWPDYTLAAVSFIGGSLCALPRPKHA